MLNKKVLPSGLTVLTEDIPYVKSISLGIMIKTGSRHEKGPERGLSHMLEHMLFKGTSKNSSFEIAEKFDLLGAYVDAFTGREYTCFFVKMTDDKLPQVLELLSDMLLNSSFTAEDTGKEKSVILEEIKMYKDQPDDVVLNMFMSGLFKGHALGSPILGDIESVSSFKNELVRKYWKENYLPGNTLVSAAGNLKSSEVGELVNKYFGTWNPGKQKEMPAAPSYDLSHVEDFKKLEQTHLVLGTEGIPFSSDKTYTLALLNDIFGGSVSSRLFQEVREKRGLAYAINSFHEFYADSGVFAIYAATDPEKKDELIEVVNAEIAKLKDGVITDNEITKAKAQAKCGFTLSMENTSNRMGKLLRQECYFGKFISVEDTLDAIEGVTKEAIIQLANTMLLEGKIKIASYGPEFKKTAK